ncbi:unnamed protein product, partial [Owenia fusiformis]
RSRHQFKTIMRLKVKLAGHSIVKQLILSEHFTFGELVTDTVTITEGCEMLGGGRISKLKDHLVESQEGHDATMLILQIGGNDLKCSESDIPYKAKINSIYTPL